MTSVDLKMQLGLCYEKKIWSEILCRTQSFCSTKLILMIFPLSRQTVCRWRFRWLPCTPLRGGVWPRPQWVEDAGQHDIFSQQCRRGHAGRNHLCCGRLRWQRVPQHDGGVQPWDRWVERLHQDSVSPLWLKRGETGRWDEQTSKGGEELGSFTVLHPFSN